MTKIYMVIDDTNFDYEGACTTIVGVFATYDLAVQFLKRHIEEIRKNNLKIAQENGDKRIERRIQSAKIDIEKELAECYGEVDVSILNIAEGENTILSIVEREVQDHLE